MNIVLIGYRGTGKSVVGTRLAARLGLRYCSLDEEIVRRAGMPIPAIVAERGWPGFRDLESAVARDVTAADGQVLDTGGGVIERAGNVAALRAAGRVIWLRASVPVIVARIQGDANRPSLTGKSFTEEVAEVLERRAPLYQAAADAWIDTDTLTPDVVVERILTIVAGDIPA